MDTKTLAIGGVALVAVVAGGLTLFGSDAPAPSPTGSGAAAVTESETSGAETSGATSGAAAPSAAAEASSTTSFAAPVTGADTPAAAALIEKGFVVGDVPIGDPEAPVTIVEYASTTCPHCATFHNQTLPALKERYIDTGKARLIVREVYFNEPGLWSSLIARCSGPEQYHAFMDVLFARQDSWASGDAQAIIANLRQLGRLAGLSAERIETCLNDQDLIRFMVDRYRAESEADAVRSTPHFLINGEVITGAQSIETFSEAIEAQLAN
ncbi:MAG: DsbA family protein [Pseudomonadota bacterium]